MGAYVGLVWPVLEHLGPSWGQVGLILAPTWSSWSHLGALLGYLRLSWGSSWLILGAAGRHEPCKNCGEKHVLQHTPKNQQH